MAKARTLVGLDVHATKVVAAVLAVETGELWVLFDDRGYRWGGGVLRCSARSGAGGV